MIKTDILVIGTGLAGAIAALTAAEKGRKVTMLTKTKEVLSGNTPYAQGGIIYKGHNDSPEKLKSDIMEAGDGICWEPAVDLLCQEGPRLVKELLIDKYLVQFDKNNDNDLDLTAEGAHSEPRIIHSKDQTGESIQKRIIRALEANPNIEILTEHTVVDLLTLSHHSKNLLDIYKKPACFGTFVLDNLTEKVYPIFASETILATGGLGQLYRHTSNAAESTGDGIALAWRAGVRCFNLQYIQFHPTTLYHERDRFLISESMRGEGGILIDKNGVEFMKKFHEQVSLAPRDIVARGIHQTLLETDHPCVYLDISFKDAEWLQNRFPNIYKHCKNAGIDLTKEPIPVVPSAHYSCGGVGVNLEGRTSFQRLYAVGEVSCTGIHGANRLASTSLLESVVWGYKAGLEAATRVDKDNYFPEIYEWKNEEEYMDPALMAQDWTTLKNSMWNYVGLIRTRQRLLRAATIFRHLQSEIEQFYQKAKLTKQLIQLRNGVQTAIAVTLATLEARESKGAHFIADKELK
jgi:L-aspartate oxidase